MTAVRPAISVIVRTIGHERLPDALASLAQQTRRDFEAVIVDMSGGRARAALDRARDRLPSVRHLEQPALRPRPVALNLGLAAAAGEAVALLDEDNRYDPAHLDCLLEGLRSSGADLAYTGVRVLTLTPVGLPVASVVRHEPFSFARLLFENYIYTAGTAFRRALWERLGGYDPRFEVYEDWDFLIRAGATGRVVRLDAVSAESRQFTGVPGAAQHTREGRRAPRCRAGIYWKHRRLRTRDRKAEYAAFLESRLPRPVAERWVKWKNWLDVFPELPGWWWASIGGIK